MSDTTARTTGTVDCDDCGERHVAEYHHNGRKEWDAADFRYFEVYCPADGLVGYYGESLVDFTTTTAAPSAASLGLDLTR